MRTCSRFSGPSNAIPQPVRSRGAIFDVLEPRRLLTYTVFGTPGDDTILMEPGGGGYTVKLNGTQVASSADTSVILSPLGGRDLVVISRVLFGSSITVRGGLGDDRFEVGDGRLFSSLNGHVYIEEFAGEGEDTFFANDIFDTTLPDRSVRVRDNLLTSGTGSLVGVHYDDNVEHKSLSCSIAADTVYVESPPAGMVLNLGDGNDTVEFGSISANDLPDFMAAGTISGGAGFDRMIFDDSGGMFDEPRDYFIDPTRFENQALLGVEKADLHVRTRGGLSANTIHMSGAGGITNGNEINFLAGFFTTDLQIGSPTQPANVSSIWASVFMDFDDGNIGIYDQAGVNDGNEWSLSRSQSTNEQLINKGLFSMRLQDSGWQRSIAINGGMTADSFAVSGLKPNNHYYVDGGGGNDSVRTANANGNDNDLDAIFTGNFRFDGGAGEDSLDLDDTGDAIGDGDEIYRLRGDLLDKGSGKLIEWGTGGPSDDDLELVRLATGADNDTIYFRGPPTYGTSVAYSIDAGSGDDYITNYIPSFDWNGGDLSWSRHDATILGGAGADVLAIDDTANNAAARNYHFESGYRLAAPSSMTYDGSIETVSLEANEGGGTIRIDTKPPNTKLTVNGRGGDDAFIIGGGDIDLHGFTVNNTTVTGGAGTNSITFDDRLDDYQHAANENEIYTLENNTFRKDVAGLLYFGFERQTIQTADVLNGSALTDNTININNNSTNIANTTITGGSVRGNGVHVSTGNITNLSGNFEFHLGTSGGNAVFLNDLTNAQAAQYSVESASITRRINFANPRTIAYSGLNFLVIDGGSNGDLMEFLSTPTGMIAYGNGNAGSDFMSIGGGASSIIAAVLGRVDLNGGGNGDTVYFDNGQNTLANTAALTGNTFSVNAGPVHNYAAFEAANLYLGNGPTDARINGASVPTQVYGGSANDTFTLTNGDIDANIAFGVTVNMLGGGGTDQIRLNDLNDTTSGFDNQYFLQAVGGVDQLLRRPGSFGLQWVAASWSGMEAATLDASNIAATIEVQDTLTPLRVNGNAGSDTISVGDTTASVTVSGGAGVDALTVNFDNAPGDAPATVNIDASDDLGYLDVKVGGTLRIVSGAVLALTGPPFASNFGTIDLAGGALMVRANAGGPLPPSIRNQIIGGRHGGAWNGTSGSAIDGTAIGAINSSLAAGSSLLDGVGYGLGSQIALVSIGPFTINAGDTLIRYTLAGDSNLDASVNVSDLGILATHWQGSGKSYTQADANYDGTVNVSDLGALATNWQKSLPAPSQSKVPALSPSKKPAPTTTAASSFGSVIVQERPAMRLWLVADVLG